MHSDVAYYRAIAGEMAGGIENRTFRTDLGVKGS